MFGPNVLFESLRLFVELPVVQNQLSLSCFGPDLLQLDRYFSLAGGVSVVRELFLFASEEARH